MLPWGSQKCCDVSLAELYSPKYDSFSTTMKLVLGIFLTNFVGYHFRTGKQIKLGVRATRDSFSTNFGCRGSVGFVTDHSIGTHPIKGDLNRYETFVSQIFVKNPKGIYFRSIQHFSSIRHLMTRVCNSSRFDSSCFSSLFDRS